MDQPRRIRSHQKKNQMTQSSPTWLSKVCYWTFTAWNTGVRLFVAFSLPFWAVGLMSRGQHGFNDRNPRDYLGLKIQNFLVDVPNQTKPLKAKSCIIATYTKTKQNHVGNPTTNLRFGDGLYMFIPSTKMWIWVNVYYWVYPI